MAAGMGSRYGGLKQIDPIGPHGEIIIDYSIFDAMRAGFEQVVFVIRRDLEEAFREKIGSKVEKRVKTSYVFQDLHNVPAGFSVPEERKKPWGTGHAVLSCQDVVTSPFAVINADDFYGLGAFQSLEGYLQQAYDQDGQYDACMVGYILRNTLSAFGSVARGVCQIDPNGFLTGIQERTRIEKDGQDARYTENGVEWHCLSGDSLVSMNMFGFTPGFFKELEQRFPIFLEKNADQILKAEFFLPDVVNALLQEGKLRVKVLPTPDRWYGVTYPADRPFVQDAVRQMVSEGLYPENLWGA